MKKMLLLLIVCAVQFQLFGQNVGIGTTTPLRKLQVAGSVMILDSLSVGPSTPLNRLDVAGTTVVGAGYAGLAIAPANGLLVQGFTGIGTTTPGFPLDVWHGGSTGMRSKSSVGFSVMDIDAADGDAALRYYRNGAALWNLRNNPFTDDFELYEMGPDGGSRIIVQDSTGNLGIATTSPIYRLDVWNSGGNGIRSKSTSVFSVVDIDAGNGDAALRLLKDGVGEWNIRNSPLTEDLEFFELNGGGTRMIIQDSTGNVGIGSISSPGPRYRLDVWHSGATGIRDKSVDSFSVVDIDAFNGDAALRFYKNGSGRWNLRNSPLNDDLEFFELGGGTRMIIQDATGNIGIGPVGTSTAYRLDVWHNGITGIRNKSLNSFSILDIDAFNGDASLRFYKNAVAQWNIRNDPATDNLQFFEMSGGGERMRIENGTGLVRVIGTLAKGAGSFLIDHPLDPENQYLYHSFVESPDMKNIYDGNIVTDAQGKAVVELPGYFEKLNRDYRYQLTVIGSFAQAIVSKKVNNNRFEIATSRPNVEVSWMVTGIRQDAYANAHRIPNAVPKEPENRGKYIHPEEFGQPKSRGIHYAQPGNEPSSVNTLPPAVKETVQRPVAGQTIAPDSPGSVPVQKTVPEKGGSTEAVRLAPVPQQPAKKPQEKSSVQQ